MNCVDVIIVVLIFLILRMMFFPKVEKYKTNRTKTIINKSDEFSDYCKKPDNEVFCEKESYSIKTKDKYQFTEMQYHPQYSDLLTAVTRISEQKQLFNKSDKPVENTTPDKKKTEKLLDHFIDTLNSSMLDVNNDIGKTTSWNENSKLQTMKSGWEKHMENLGLPSSIYNNDVTDEINKSKLRLLEIHSVYALETECDMRITCIILCKKNGLDDKILLRVNFWVDNNDVNNDRDFFKDDTNTYSIISDDELKVVIEYIFILGYFVRNPCGTDKFSKKRDKFYHFDNIEKDGMIDQEQVLTQLMEKQKNRADEINTRICKSGKDKEDIPHLSEYNSYRNTRTIFDDIKNKKEFDIFNNDF